VRLLLLILLQQLSHNLISFFSVAATGDGLNYQWQYNTTAVPGTWVNVGTNSNSYTVPSPSVSFGGRTYRVVITGTCGTVTNYPSFFNCEQSHTNSNFSDIKFTTNVGIGKQQQLLFLPVQYQEQFPTS
jgi:hypothetical protein